MSLLKRIFKYLWSHSESSCQLFCRQPNQDYSSFSDKCVYWTFHKGIKQPIMAIAIIWATKSINCRKNILEKDKASWRVIFAANWLPQNLPHQEKTEKHSWQNNQRETGLIFDCNWLIFFGQASRTMQLYIVIWVGNACGSRRNMELKSNSSFALSWP